MVATEFAEVRARMSMVVGMRVGYPVVENGLDRAVAEDATWCREASGGKEYDLGISPVMPSACRIDE